MAAEQITSAMKNLFLFLSFLLGSISLTGQMRLDVAGDARIKGRLEINSGSSNLFIGQNAGLGTTSGTNNLFLGNSAGLSNTEGESNIFIGPVAGFSNTSGMRNTVIGAGAGLFNTAGSFNTFLGDEAGRSSTADNNTFIGSKAGFANTTGQLNAFVGEQAGYANNTGSSNTFIGSKAGVANTSGGSNTFVGREAGFSNTGSYYNTFMGHRAGHSNTGTSSGGNTFVGYEAGFANLGGNSNTFLGNQAGFANLSAYNTFLGSDAGYQNTTGGLNTFLGCNAGFFNTTGDDLIAIGYYSDASLLDNTPINNAFVIGNRGLMTSSHSGTLGNLSTQKITGYVNFGTASDGRMKKQIREDVHGLDFILALRPVTYQVDALKLDQFLRQGMEAVGAGKEGDLTAEEKASTRERQATYEGYLREKAAIRYTGFIAQEVEKALTESGFDFSGLVKPAHDQDHYSLRYAEFVVPLVKGMQEQQEMIEELKEQNTEQQEQIDELKNLVQQLLAQQPNQTPVQQLDLKQPAALFQNHPNPFHENTVIRYFLPEGTEPARLEVYSVDGKLLTTLPLAQRGEGQVQLKAGSFPAGTYLYSLIIGNEVRDTKRMVLSK